MCRPTNYRMHRLDEMTAEDERHWQSDRVHEQMDSIFELTTFPFALKDVSPDVRLNETRIRLLQQPQR